MTNQALRKEAATKKLSKDKEWSKIITESTLRIVITTIISIGLIGGGGFLLFTHKNEIKSIDQTWADFDMQSAEVKLATQMINSQVSSWFTDLLHGEEMVQVYRCLRNSATDRSLEQTFSRKTLLWCFQAMSQLTSERGQVKGFIFSIDSYKRYQTATITFYDALINYVQKICELTSKWDTLSEKERQEQIIFIERAWFDVNERVNTRLSLSLHIQSESDLLIKQNQRRLEETKSKLIDLMIKSILSTFGVVLGICLLLFCAWCIFDKEKALKKSSGSSKNKSKSNGRR